MLIFQQSYKNVILYSMLRIYLDSFLPLIASKVWMTFTAQMSDKDIKQARTSAVFVY